MASRKIAVLGAGKAGEALIAGLLSSGWRKPSEIAATARHEERLADLSERHGIETTLSNVDAAASAVRSIYGGNGVSPCASRNGTTSRLSSISVSSALRAPTRAFAPAGSST